MDPTTVKEGEDDYESYLTDVDEKGRDAFFALTPTQRKLIMQQGSLHTARNPTGALLVRIRDLKRAGEDDATITSYKEFLSCVKDPPLVASFYTLAPLRRLAVVQQGPLHTAKNPVSALKSRITAASQGCYDDDYNYTDFLKDTDRVVRQAFLSLHADQRHQVLEQCLRKESTITNKNGFLMSSIRSMREGKWTSGSGAPMPGGRMDGSMAMGKGYGKGMPVQRDYARWVKFSTRERRAYWTLIDTRTSADQATEALRDWKQETITIWEADLLAHGCKFVDDRWKDREGRTLYLGIIEGR